MALLKQTFNFRAPTPSMVAANIEEGLQAPIKRTSVEVELDFLTVPQIIELLTSGDDATKSLIVSQVNQPLIDEVRDQLDNLPNYEEVDQTKLDFSKVNFVSIANTPRAARAGSGIAEEVWDAFGVDFTNTIVAATANSKTPRTAEQLKTPVKLFTKSLKDVSKQEAVLNQLQNYLDAWFTRTTDDARTQFAAVYERLSARIKGYLDKVNDNPLDALDLS